MKSWVLASIRIAALSRLLMGCAQGDLPEYQKLDRLRILSLKATPPETAPGATVAITPFISDVEGGGRDLDYLVLGCADPGLDRGEEPHCDAAADKAEIARGTITAINSPDFATAARTGAVAGVNVAIPANLLQGKSQLETLRGVDYLVTYELIASDGSKLRSLKRISVSANPSPNANPDLTAFRVDGNEAPAALPADKFTLLPNYSAKENYLAIRSDGTTAAIDETLLISWFTLGGEIERTQTYDDEENTFTPDPEPHSSGKTLLIGVARDGRGGEDVLKLEY